MAKVKVELFGVVAEICGAKHMQLENSSILEIKELLNSMHPELKNISLIYAVNNSIIEKNKNLADGDVIAVMPPFSGG
ncbi:MAG: MoaD/ThiS family protein [Bacteroidia bacterium]